ncbi:MAG: TonB-dependent receptor plug domain-containing protein [Tannerella sp.]|jgi:TonB-dependent SusC/RagA subfamily outer membrane receptor|nr:TonB-dependent receptor plug domain-containing protein [Tannerella sp.]
MKKVVFLLMSFSLIISMSGQVSNVPEAASIGDSLQNQLIAFPQEKLYLHTDRNFYVPGEKIWFKAYLVNAITHQEPTRSRYVYVELINASDSLIERVMLLKNADNMFHGNIFLSEIIPEGFYTLRAYTRYMENLGENYFFEKNIQIGNLNTDNQSVKSKNKKSENKDYDVSFFPEGGNFPEEELCIVAFKALNEDGAPEEITGEIIDDKDMNICNIETFYSGMGYFVLMPEKGKTYFLKCKNKNGLEKRLKLPPAQNACAVKISGIKNNWFVSVSKSPDYPDQQLYMLIHCRGVPLHFTPWNREKESLSISKQKLPAGVIQILLLDRDLNPVSERLIFNKNNDTAKVVFTSGKTFYGKREKVVAEMSVTDSEGVALTGNLSVAVTDNKDFQIDTATTILSSLLLSSELKGHIENPAYYLQNTPQAEFALDLLMKTHGWRRYDIPAVIRGKKAYPEYLFEEAQSVTGQVKTLFLEKPVENGEIAMFSSDGGFGQTTTNSLGYFSFFGLEYADSTKFFVQAKNKKGSDRVILEITPETFPELQHIPLASQSVENEKDTIDVNFMEKAGQRAKYDEDMKMIHLPEVVVTAKKIDKKDEIRLQNWMNASSDATIYREDIEKRHALNVTNLLYGVAGVQVGANGTISIRGGGRPLILIDGMEMPWPEQMGSVYDSPLEMVNVDDVESIDIFKGPSAAIFGMRGGNGAISITTRRGEINSSQKANWNFASISPLGFQKPVEFYAPKYDTAESRKSPVPDYRTTLFWKPDIVISDEGKASFEFYSADFPTIYSVVIEGIASDGQIVRHVAEIEVHE